jgi:hypothetical protein
VPAFGGGRDEASAVPNEERFTQTRARREHGDVGALLLRMAGVAEDVAFRARHFERPQRESDQVVEERDALDR